MNKTQDEFDKYRKEVDLSVNNALKGVKAGVSRADFNDYLWKKLNNEIGELVWEAIGAEIGQIELAVPPAHIGGDFSLEVFSLAKKIGENPNTMAKKIAGFINEGEVKQFIERAAAVGAFVNIEVKKREFYRKILAEIEELGARYGESNVNAGKTAVIDFSAPNIAKPIGVGHLRSTIIGQALANIYEETGYAVVKDNHVGDWGTQFGKLIWAWQHWGKEEMLKDHPVEALKDLYVKFNAYAKDHLKAADEARKLFARLEAKDPELVALWKRFRDLSLKDFQKIYLQLGVEFDTAIGESYFSDRANEVVELCLGKKLCQKDVASEAIIVDGLDGLPSFLLRKQDGSSLYLTRDLVALKFRVDAFNPDVILYVVGSEQELNFRQMFALAKIMGYLNENVVARHIGFGMVLVNGKKMSTREGTAVGLEELMTQAIAKAKEILMQKNPAMESSDMETVSGIVGIGAIVYNDLRQSRTNNITFDWKRMLDLEGGSAVYLQYSYVRIQSILKKLKEAGGEGGVSGPRSEIAFENQIEFEVAKKLMIFPDIILKARQADYPHYIAVYLEELATLFNSFYNEVSIIKTEDQKLRESRIMLIEAVASVIKKGLSLLGIKVPEKM